MNKILIKNNFLLTVFILISFTVISYWKVPSLFFQQDEWLVFGLITDQGLGIILRGLGSSNIFHFIPIDQFLNYYMFTTFRLNPLPYNIAGLLFHLLNSFLIYIVVLRLLKSYFIALLSSIVFITSSIAAQLVMWPVVSLNTISLSFILLVWIFILRYESGKNQKTIASGLPLALFSLLAFLTLEYSMSLLIFVPLSVVILSGRKQLRPALKFIFPFICVCFLYLLLRLYPIFFNSVGGGVSSSSFQVDILIYKLSRLPLRYIGQLFIPEQLIISVSNFIATKFSLIPTSLLSKVTFITGGLMFALMSLTFLSLKKVSIDFSKKFLLVLVFIISGFFPFVFLPGAAGDFSLFPPRYLYYGIAGASFFIAFLFKLAFMKNNKFLIMSVILFFLISICLGLIYNWKREDELLLQSKIRRNILTEVKNTYPKLKEKTIIYTQSDHSYYGLPEDERILPFQSGFGQTLLMWYSNTENFPQEFYKGKFLWEITDQGYKEVGKRGFGYFRDFELLGRTIVENNLSLDSVVAFSFDSDIGIMRDTTYKIQERLKGYLTKKILIDSKHIKASASENMADAYLAIDNNRQTFWNSKLAYIHSQSISLDLGKQTPVAELQIDSYNNKDQNEVGYRILLSNDNQNWQEVFYEKKYPPNKEGLAKFYFKPQNARFIKIEQKGNHPFASWIIHEIKVYEAI